MFDRSILILKEMCSLIWREKAYFVAPILIVIALLIFLVLYTGPTVVTAFIYAGF